MGAARTRVFISAAADLVDPRVQAQPPSVSVVHVRSLKPDLHVHMKWFAATAAVLCDSMHIPPFKHGFDMHSSTSTSQTEPLKPGRQVQAYRLVLDTSWRQTPPCKHGLDRHASPAHSPPTHCASAAHSHRNALRFSLVQLALSMFSR